MRMSTSSIAGVTLAAAVSLLCMSPLSAQEATKFRGLYIGMDKASVASTASAFTSQESPSGDISLSAGGDECAVIKTNGGRVVVAMTLQACYFGSSGLSIEEFAQKLVDAYKIEKMSFFSTSSSYGKMEGYRGETPYGEVVSLARAGLVKTRGPGIVWLPGYDVRVSKPASPKF